MALNFLRNGGDIFSLARILGDTFINILKSYLTRIAHTRYSPVDNLPLVSL